MKEKIQRIIDWWCVGDSVERLGRALNKKEYNVDKVILGYVHDIGKYNNGEFYGHVMRKYRY